MEKGITPTTSDPAYFHAAALLMKDCFKLPILTVVLSAPFLLCSLIGLTSHTVILLSVLCQDILFYILSFYLLQKLKGSPVSISKIHFNTILIGATLFWALRVTPQLIVPSSLLGGIIGTLSVVLWFLMFFFTVPVVEGKTDLIDIFRRTLELLTRDYLAPLKGALAPAAIAVLLSGLIASPFPDGRYQSTSLLIQLVEGFRTVLLCYIGSSFAFSVSSRDSESEQSASSLPDNRGTIDENNQGSDELEKCWLAESLMPPHALLVLGLGLFIWGRNITVLDTLPPAVDITLKSTHSLASEIRINLSLKDPEFGYTGFSPSSFSIADASRKTLSAMPDKIMIGSTLYMPEELPFSSAISPHKAEQLITLIFHVQYTQEELQQLPELHLWYRGVRISPIMFKEEPLLFAKTKNLLKETTRFFRL